MSVYNFPAQQRPSFGNQRISNFEVMAVRETKLRSRLSKNIHLSRDFQSLQDFKYMESACVNGFWLRSENQSIDQVTKVSSRCLHYFTGGHVKGHFDKYLKFGTCTHLKLIFQLQYHKFLTFIHCVVSDFISYCVAVHTLQILLILSCQETMRNL